MAWTNQPRALLDGATRQMLAVLSSYRTVLKAPVLPRRARAGLRLLGLAWLGATHLALADPAAGGAQACQAATPQEAKVLADALYEKGEFQRAGECYDVAGDSLRAQRAFLKAVGPSSEATARGLREERDAAKALFARTEQAFHSNH